jgi:hypothetical protein
MDIRGSLQLTTQLTFNSQVFRNANYAMSVENLTPSAHSFVDEDIIRIDIKNLNRSSKILDIRARNLSQNLFYGEATIAVTGPLGEEIDQSQF